MVRSRKSKSSKKSGSSGSLVSLPTEVLKLLGYYLNLGPGSWPQSRLYLRSIQKELRSLTSTSKLFYDLFKPDRYHSLLLWGVSKDLEFLTSLLKKEDVLPLIRTLQIGRFDPLKDEFHAPFATFLSRLRSLTTFIYSSDGPIPPSLVQTISNSKRHPFLANVHLLSSALVSIEEFARIRRFSGRPPFSSLKRLTLTEEPCEAFFLPEDSIEEGDTDPGWLKNHPKRRWPFVEHSLLHQVSQLLSRSNSTLEHLELNLYLTFQPQDFGSDETNLHTLFSVPVGPSCSNPGSSHSSQLPFPRLVELVLPAANLGSPFFRKLFRTSPNLRNLQVQHVTLGGKEVSDPVAYGGGSLSRLETLHVSAYSSDLVGPAVGSVWKLIRAPLPSTLRKLHLALKSTDGKLLRYIGGRFVELEDLFLTASTWKCSMEVVTTCLSSLPKLSKLHFNVPPDFASPPSPVPNVEELAAEEFLINSATEILQDLDFYFNRLNHRSHFIAIIAKLAQVKLQRLESVSWSIDPKLTLAFTISRSKDSEPVVELELRHFELDYRAEIEAEWGIGMSEDEEEEEEEEEEEQSEEEEDESSTSHDLADGASFTPPSAPPLSPSLDASTTVADLVAEGLLIPKPPLPSIESTSPSSPPSTAPVPTSRPNDLPDSSSTSSDTTSATPPNIQLPSSLPQDGIALSGPRTTPDLDGTFERRGREGRLASIFSLPEDGELGKGSSASSIVDTRSEIGGELRVDRFWESWACLYELD